MCNRFPANKIILPCLLALALSTFNATATDLERCEQIVDDLERLFCYDDISNQEHNASEEALYNRNKLAEAAQTNPFAIAPYQPNYLIPLSFNTKPNRAPFEQVIEPGGTMDKLEVKFQYSFQVDIKRDMYHSGIDAYFAFTQIAFWQAYNSGASSPFRETNYEPELGIKLNPNYELFGLRNFQLRLGVAHESNGRSDPLSRSWNRVVGTLMFSHGNYVAVFRPWIRIPEPSEDDNNPDIEDYLGNFELYNIYKKGESTYAVLFRNNLQTTDNRGALQIDMSIALNKRFKLYLQYFNGYGESLIDYNHISNRFGIGIMLTDWL